MRLEDWQKWLDTQFIDPAQAREEAEPVPDAVEAPLLPDQEPISETLSERFAASDTDSAALSVEKRIEPNGFVDDVSVPSIEQYLPFLRGTSVPGQDDHTPAAQIEDAIAASDVQEETATADIDSADAAASQQDEEVITVKEDPSETAEPIEFAPNEAIVSVVVEKPEIAVQSSAKPIQPEAQSEDEIPAHVRAVQPGRRVSETHKRTRNVKHVDAEQLSTKLAGGELWNLTPKHIQTLMAAGSAATEQNSYELALRESRIDLISKMLDPNLSLEDAARLLNVRALSVRTPVAKGLLTHQRASGDQRRFKLSDVLSFLETQSRTKSGQR